MKITILTEPPSTVRSLPRAAPQFAGSYLGILTLQRALEGKGHTVETFVALPDKRIFSEHKVHEVMISRGCVDLDSFAAEQPVSLTQVLRDTECVVLAMRGANLLTFLPQILLESNLDQRRPIVFASVGPGAGKLATDIAKKFNHRVIVLARPGVARLTRQALNVILETLDVGETRRIETGEPPRDVS